MRRGLKVLSATGVGGRADPTRIRIADLKESINDPLSRAVCCLIYWYLSSLLELMSCNMSMTSFLLALNRLDTGLKRDHNIEGGVPVVFSLEKPKLKLPPFRLGLNGVEENPSGDYQVTC